MALVFRPQGANIQAMSRPIDELGASLVQAREAMKKRQLKNFDKALGDYYATNVSYDGGLSIADGELTFTGKSKLPSYQDAWSDYKTLLEDHGQDSGFTAQQKFKTLYSGMMQEYGNSLKNDITKFKNAGYSDRSIRNALTDSDVYLNNANAVMGDLKVGSEFSGILSDYIPKKSILAGMSDAPGKTGLGVAGLGGLGYGAYSYGSGIDSEVLEGAKDTYKRGLSSARKELTDITADANKLVDKAKDSDEYKNIKDKRTKPAKKIIADAKKRSSELIDEAQDKFKQNRKNLKLDAPTRASNLVKKIGKTPNLVKGVGYAAVPMMIQGAITELTDNTDVGEIGGEAAAASMTTAQAISSGAKLTPAINVIKQQIKKHGTAKVMKEVLKKGGFKLAGRTLAKAGAGTIGGAFTGGAMTALMAAWSLKDLYDISQIIADM